MNANSFSRQGLVSWRKMFFRLGLKPERCMEGETSFMVRAGYLTTYSGLSNRKRAP